MERRKDSMISALWSNEGFNDDKGSRQNAITEIEGHFQAAIDNINGPNSRPDEEEIDPDNPFFSSTARKMQQLDEKIQGGTVQDHVDAGNDYDRYIDQA
jgi:hypothetical protein